MPRFCCYKTSSHPFINYTMISRNFSFKNFLHQSCRRYHQIQPIAKDAGLLNFRKGVKTCRPTPTAINKSFGSLASSCHYEIQYLKKSSSLCNIVSNDISHKKNFYSSFENIKSASINKASKNIPSFDHLLSYVDVCVDNGDMNHAQEVLLHFVENKKFDYGKDTIKLFNVVLHGWASEGNWNRVKELLGKIEAFPIKPNLQSFSAAIESIVRSSSDINSIKEILTKIENRSDLSLENLFEECTFVSDQQEKILEGIRLAYPNFIRKGQDKQQNLWNAYDTELLKDLKSSETKHDYKKTGKNPLSLKELQQLVRLQFERECAVQVPVPSIMKPTNNDYLKWREIWNNYMKMWQKSLCEAFQENVLKLDKNKSQLSLYPYLTVMNQETYVTILMQVMHKIIENPVNGWFYLLKNDVGRKLMHYYFLEKNKKNGVLDKTRVMHEKFVEYYCDRSISMMYTPREYWELIQKQFSVEGTAIPRINSWPTEVLQGITAFLLQILIKNVLINNNLFRHASEEMKMPAFNFITNDIHPRVECSKDLKTLYLAAYGGEMMMMDSTLLPMLSPPLPWTSLYSGGFLTFQMSAFHNSARYCNKYQKQLETFNPHSFYGIFDGLNKLSSCRWKINEPLLDLAIDIYSNGGNPDDGISLCPPSELEKGCQIEKEAALFSRPSTTKIEEEHKELYVHLALSVANTLRKNIIWLPLIADFHGLVFPCVYYFSHYVNGIDGVIRSLFLFADGEELGEKGLEWLKIHLVNLTGFQKNSSLKERLKYFDEILEDVMDSADNPLKGRKWWMKSKNPWLTLACCMELSKCLRSPEPLKYICHLPIHQDGSANYFQHSSALVQDEHCAEMVNLIPNDKPIDIYEKISNKIERERQKDETKNIKIAKEIKGFISRSLIKDIILRMLNGTSHARIIQATRSTFPTELQGEASAYLIEKASYIAQDMFSSIKQLQNWFRRVATIISRDYQENVKWISPLGFPVILPVSNRNDVENMLIEMIEKDSLDFDINSSELEGVVNINRQKRAFFIHYIHCLESSHTMLTALHCQRYGIEIANIRDCFWTLPSNADVMNEIIREQFVALHSQPLLRNLAGGLTELFIHPKYNNSKMHKSQLKLTISQLPKAGKFDVKKVLNSTYFFC